MMSREGTVPLVAGGGGRGPGTTFTLYPVFASPEEEYKYISSRMAELERHLGMASDPKAVDLTTSCVTLPPSSTTPKPKKEKKEKTKKKKKKDGKREETKEKRKKEGSKIKKTKKDKATKVKKKNRSTKGFNKEKEAAASDLDTSQEQDSTVSVDKAKELERDSDFGGADVQNQVQAIDQELREAATTDTGSESDGSASSKPRLRKAASFLFNKTSEMRSYFRKMSADIRDLASTKEMDATAQTSTTTKDLKKAPSFKQQKKKSNKKRQRRSAQEGPYNASSSGDDLNNMQADSDSDDGSQLTYDARYTDAVFVFSSSSDSRQLHPVVGHNYGHTISDHETFSIMIEEDTATYDSPTMLATAMPEVEIDVELDETSDDDGEIDHHRHATVSIRATNAATVATAGPRHSLASWRQPAALPPAMLRVPSSPVATTSLASKASYRMTMPPVLPPSTAQPAHLAAHAPNPQSRGLLPAVGDAVPQPPFRSGWGARRPLPPIPTHGGLRTRSYAHSSGAVPTSARPRTGTCIC